jgi:hypothetical protein
MCCIVDGRSKSFLLFRLPNLQPQLDQYDVEQQTSRDDV